MFYGTPRHHDKKSPPVVKKNDMNCFGVLKPADFEKRLNVHEHIKLDPLLFLFFFAAGDYGVNTFGTDEPTEGGTNSIGTIVGIIVSVLLILAAAGFLAMIVIKKRYANVLYSLLILDY